MKIKRGYGSRGTRRAFFIVFSSSIKADKWQKLFTFLRRSRACYEHYDDAYHLFDFGKLIPR